MGAASRFGAATMVSRVLGLVREQAFAALVGAGGLADAFVVAFRIPNLLRDLFAEGALSAAFVPTFTDRLRNGAPGEAWRLANRVVNFLVLALGALVLVAMLFPVPIVRLLASGFPEDRIAITARLTQVMLPFLPIVSVSAVLMGALTAQGRFGAPALAPTMFNLVSIAFAVGLWLFGFKGEEVVIGWATGTLLGGLAQLLIQLPSLRATGWRWRPDLDLTFQDPGLRRIARLMAPATIGLAATQVNIVVNTTFASADEGAAAWLSYAFRLMQLPIGVFGVAIATVAQTGISVAAAAKDQPAVDRTVGSGLRLVAFLTLPAAGALISLGIPIIRLIYERGRFTPSDTEQTALALAGYAVGLGAYAAVKVLAPAFYALDHARVPLYASIAAVAVNLTLNVALHPVLGFVGLALGTSLGAIANVGVLLWMYRRLGGSLVQSGLAGHMARVGAAVLGSSLAGWGAARVLETLLPTSGFWQAAASVTLGLGAAVSAYLLAARLLGINELNDAIGLVGRRIGRTRPR